MPIFRLKEQLGVFVSNSEIEDMMKAAVDADIADGFTLEDGSQASVSNLVFLGVRDVKQEVDGKVVSTGADLIYTYDVVTTTDPADPNATPEPGTGPGAEPVSTEPVPGETEPSP